MASTFFSRGAHSSRPSWCAFVSLLSSIPCGRSHMHLGPRSEHRLPVGTWRSNKEKASHPVSAPARPLGLPLPSPGPPGISPLPRDPLPSLDLCRRRHSSLPAPGLSQDSASLPYFLPLGVDLSLSPVILRACSQSALWRQCSPRPTLTTPLPFTTWMST